MKHVVEPSQLKTHRAITAAMALALLLASLGTSIANIALPALADAFSASFSDVRWVVISYLAAMTVTTVVAGKLGDAYGHKRMLLVGLGVFGVASLLCGIASNLPLLIGARAIQGAGAAFLMTLSMTVVRGNTGDKNVGRAMGLLGTVSAVGTALGPSLGGLLIPMVGWRGVFLVQVPLAALALVMVAALVPRTTDPIAATASLPPNMDRALVPTLTINVVVAAVMMTTLVVGPFYLSLGLGLREAHVGLVMSIGPLVAIFSGTPSGRLVDAWGASRTRTTGLFMLAGGAVLLAVLPNIVGVGGYVLAIVILTPGYQLVQAANNTAALMYVAQDRRGTVSGLLALSRNIGLIAGASIMSAVFAFGVGVEDLSQAGAAAAASGMRMTFLFAGSLIIVALWIASASDATLRAANRSG